MKKIILSLCTGFLFSTAFAQIPVKGLVAWYPFSGNANDYSDYNNNGTVNGANLTTDRFGNPNSAYSFNGSNNSIIVPHDSSIAYFPKGQTVSVWMKISAYPTDGNEHYYIQKTSIGTRAYYEAFLSDYTNVNWSVYRYGQSSAVSSQANNIKFSDIPLNEWVNITYTTDLTTTKSYINGRLVCTFNSYSPIGYNTQPLYIGSAQTVGGFSSPFNGILDDLRIYNRPLDSLEVVGLVKENACQTTTRVLLPENINTNGLLAYYPLNNDAKDYSGNNYDGVVIGATPTTDRFGVANKAYSFDGVSSQISFYNQFIFNQSGDATVSMWLNPNTPVSNIQGTFLKSSLDVADANRFNFFINPLTNNNSKLNLDYRESNTNIHILNNYTNFTLNNWHLVTYTRVGNAYNMYVDGVLINSVTDSSPALPNAIGWVLGNDPSSTLDYKGSIDDVKIYNRALTQQEISALYSENLCVTSTNVTDTLTIQSVTGFNSLPSGFTLKVFPNPTKSILNISVSNPTNNYTVQIANSQGSIVYNGGLTNANTQVNLSSLGANGLYFIRILDSGNNVVDVRKIVLE